MNHVQSDDVNLELALINRVSATSFNQPSCVLVPWEAPEVNVNIRGVGYHGCPVDERLG